MREDHPVEQFAEQVRAKLETLVKEEPRFRYPRLTLNPPGYLGNTYWTLQLDTSRGGRIVELHPQLMSNVSDAAELAKDVLRVFLRSPAAEPPLAVDPAQVGGDWC